MNASRHDFTQAQRNIFNKAVEIDFVDAVEHPRRPDMSTTETALKALKDALLALADEQSDLVLGSCDTDPVDMGDAPVTGGEKTIKGVFR